MTFEIIIVTVSTKVGGVAAGYQGSEVDPGTLLR